MRRSSDTTTLTNKREHDSFLRNALSITGSVTPVVARRVLIVILYSCLVTFFTGIYPHFSLAMAPFEYSGAVLGILLVFRLTAGNERWWEARKWWGSIVNQSRNLATIGKTYTHMNEEWKRSFLNHVACLPYVFKNSLQSDRSYDEYTSFLSKDEAIRITEARHMPTYISGQIAALTELARREDKIDGFAFIELDHQRSLLIDAIGACERILKTPMPLVVAIKARRFILLFLLLLPYALIDELGWMTPLVSGLVSYALFSLDQIGIELQHPFDEKRLSHLPLKDICKTIADNVLELEEYLEPGTYSPEFHSYTNPQQSNVSS